MDRIKNAIIKKLRGYDKRGWNEYSRSGWAMTDAYGKMRIVHQIKYHWEGCSMVVDEVIYSSEKIGG